MVVTLCKLEGQSPGLQIIMELNAADSDYKDLKQLVTALAKCDLALDSATGKLRE